jgi:hypothetical protein
MKTLLCAHILLASSIATAQTWQWSKHIGGPGLDLATTLKIDNSGNIYLTGSYAIQIQANWEGCYFDEDTLTGSHDSFLAKYASTGELLWLRDIPCTGAIGIAALVLDQNNAVFYTLGTFEGSCLLDTVTVSATTGVGVVLAKWNFEGHCLWARSIASSGLVFDLYGVVGNSLVLDGSGELMVCLSTSPYGLTQVESEFMSSGTFLGKYDGEGQALWWKPFTEFTGTEKSVSLYELEYHAGRIYGYGAVTIPQGGGDTTTVDSIQIFGREGRGFALVSIDPNTGVAEWFRLDGFPNGNAGYQQMSVDSHGNIVVVGSYGGTNSMAVFGTDTLSSAASYSKGFIAKYILSGNLLYVREFAGSNTFYFGGVDLSPDGYMAITGAFKGQIPLGGSSFTSNTNKDLFVAIHDPVGEPRAFMHGGTGAGQSIRFFGNDLVFYGVFPGETTPFGSISIGDETYTSHGYGDIVLARTSLPTSVAPKSSMDERLLIYANPNQGSFRIVMPEGLRYASNLMLRVYDATGRQLHQQKLDIGDERPKVDLFGVSPGFYMVTIGNGQQSYSGNLVVE